MAAHCLFLCRFLVPAAADLDSLFLKGCSPPPVLHRACENRDTPEKRLGGEAGYLPRSSRMPRAEEPASLGLSLVYVGEFCGLKACVHTARESKPSRGKRSISQETIYARTNPGGAGMHPAAGEAAPRFAGNGRGSPARPVARLDGSPVPSPSRSRRDPVPPRRRAVKRIIGWWRIKASPAGRGGRTDEERELG